MRLDDLDIPWGTGVFRRTKRISFELSNICNLAQQHKQCPLHFQDEPRILPEFVIDGVLETCQKFRFAGVFAFHLYNEPGIDPRLVSLMDKIKSRLPDSKLFLLTNGWYLNQTLAEELVQHGLDFLSISSYSQRDHERLARIQLDIPVSLIRQTLDDRLTWYESPIDRGRSFPCYCPLYEICITCEGLVSLCPYDWQRQNVFGDLSVESLEEVLERREPWRVYEGLASGRRTLDICRGCHTSRGEPYPQGQPPLGETAASSPHNEQRPEG